METNSSRFGRVLVTAVAAGALIGALAGCQKEGPAERAGKEVDNVVKKITQRVDLAPQGLLDAVTRLAP